MNELCDGAVFMVALNWTLLARSGFAGSRGPQPFREGEAGLMKMFALLPFTSPSDFVAFDCLTDRDLARQERGLIRQEYERYLPLPRLGEGRGEALAVGSRIRPPPPGRYRARTSPRGGDSNAVSDKV